MSKIIFAIVVALAALMAPQSAIATRYPTGAPFASGKPKPPSIASMYAGSAIGGGTKRARGRGR